MAEKDQSLLAVRTRQREHKEEVMEYVGELLIPVTEGFEQINLDMSFSYLSNWDLAKVDYLNDDINLCFIYGFDQAEFLLRGKLASMLISARSRGGKSMDLFTTIVTKQEQEFKDKTEKKHGFSLFGLGMKKKET